MRRPRLALVPGEPAGVGPELCVFAAQRGWDADLVALAAGETLLRAAGALDLPLRLVSPDAAHVAPGELRLIEVRNEALSEFGAPDPRNAQAVIAALEQAADGCASGAFNGVVTGPVHKAAINAGGIAFTGTTELLAQRAGCEVVMMLASDTMRVALATTHLPLRAVPDAISADGLLRTLRIVHEALRTQFRIATPRIIVLGLNPHAGEAGHLGREEIEVIEPAIAKARSEGMRIDGPLPADTAFLPARLTGCDAVLAMYHDQGLPVLKHAGFERAVNITLGLPWPRVAVDHGTALDLAGTGRADPSSLFAAIETCARMARAEG